MLTKTEQNKRRSARPRAVLPVLPAFADDSEVLTFKQWCALNKISDRKGLRILKGPGPIVTQLSARRIGITKKNNRLWLESRERRRSKSPPGARMISTIC